MSEETERKTPNEIEFEELRRAACEGYPLNYSGTVDEAGEVLNRICWKLHYWHDANTNESYHPLGNSISGALYGATLDLYMKDAPFDYRAVARKHINEALGRKDL